MDDYDVTLGDTILQDMKDDLNIGELSDQELMVVLLKMSVFQLGLSVMVANELLPKNFDEQAQINLLESLGSDVINGTTSSK